MNKKSEMENKKMDEFTVVETNIYVNIWRFMFDKRNRDIRGRIVSFLTRGDHFNLWAARFGWQPWSHICGNLFCKG